MTRTIHLFGIHLLFCLIVGNCKAQSQRQEDIILLVRERINEVINLTYADMYINAMNKTKERFYKQSIVTSLLEYDELLFPIKTDSTKSFDFKVKQVDLQECKCFHGKILSYEYKYNFLRKVLSDRYQLVDGKLTKVGKYWKMIGMYPNSREFRYIDLEDSLLTEYSYLMKLGLVVVDTTQSIPKVFVASSAKFTDNLDFLLKDETILSDIECYIKIRFYNHKPSEIVVLSEREATFFSNQLSKVIRVSFEKVEDYNDSSNKAKKNVIYFYTGSEIIK